MEAGRGGAGAGVWTGAGVWVEAPHPRKRLGRRPTRSSTKNRGRIGTSRVSGGKPNRGFYAHAIPMVYPSPSMYSNYLMLALLSCPRGLHVSSPIRGVKLVLEGFRQGLPGIVQDGIHS
jgi:hypothetical protein